MFENLFKYHFLESKMLEIYCSTVQNLVGDCMEILNNNTNHFTFDSIFNNKTQIDYEQYSTVQYSTVQYSVV